jgi:CheY-like chemotaxis protein
MLIPPAALSMLKSPTFTPDSGERPLILIADDHEDSRTIARIMVERAGFNAAEATTGLETLARARSKAPKVILLDMIMPEMDGWTVAKLLRSDPATAGIVIVAFTACVRTIDRERALDAGCDLVLTKPMQPRALMSVLQSCVEQGRVPRRIDYRAS